VLIGAEGCGLLPNALLGRERDSSGANRLVPEQDLFRLRRTNFAIENCPTGSIAAQIRAFDRYWGRHFWARGYFCTTSGNITDEAILQYLKLRDATSAL
jgi:REP element-mobilizing transposase RayT